MEGEELMPERYRNFYDDDGHFLGYWPVWHNWPCGEQGFNIDYFGDNEPECPICGLLLRQTEPEPDYLGVELDTVYTTYICEDCQTQYYGPVREQEQELLKHEEQIQEQATVNTTQPEHTKPVSIKERYRYLIG